MYRHHSEFFGGFSFCHYVFWFSFMLICWYSVKWIYAAVSNISNIFRIGNYLSKQRHTFATKNVLF